MPPRFPGPPDYKYYPLCLDVYQAAMIMVEAVIPPWLIAHADRIRVYDEMYGQRCWPLLYQQDNRFRKGHMPRMLRRGSEKMDKVIEHGTATEFAPAKPWGYLFFLAASPDDGGAAEHRW